jgi:hypothetical protein
MRANSRPLVDAKDALQFVAGRLSRVKLSVNKSCCSMMERFCKSNSTSRILLDVAESGGFRGEFRQWEDLLQIGD